MSIIGWLVFGGFVGWIASKIMGTDAQQGILLNILVGVVGAVLGGFLWGMFTQDPDPYKFWHLKSWVTAIVGSSLLLWLCKWATEMPYYDRLWAQRLANKRGTALI